EERKFQQSGKRDGVARKPQEKRSRKRDLVATRYRDPSRDRAKQSGARPDHGRRTSPPRRQRSLSKRRSSSPKNAASAVVSRPIGQASAVSHAPRQRYLDCSDLPKVEFPPENEEPGVPDAIQERIRRV